MPFMMNARTTKPPNGSKPIPNSVPKSIMVAPNLLFHCESIDPIKQSPKLGAAKALAANMFTKLGCVE
jgi:hypothetical protein